MAVCFREEMNDKEACHERHDASSKRQQQKSRTVSVTQAVTQAITKSDMGAERMFVDKNILCWSAKAFKSSVMSRTTIQQYCCKMRLALSMHPLSDSPLPLSLDVSISGRGYSANETLKPCVAKSMYAFEEAASDNAKHSCGPLSYKVSSETLAMRTTGSKQLCRLQLLNACLPEQIGACVCGSDLA